MRKPNTESITMPSLSSLQGLGSTVKGVSDDKNVVQMALDRLIPFKDHPYKVIENESLTELIESIALNSARSAQVGIKSAKVRVSSGKNDAIKVALSAVLYSNVEIPASMAKVQEKIKKDIERYTGIVVEAVSVKVSKVEPVVAKVDK